MNRDQLSVPEIAHIDITFNGELLMNIFIYDVVNEEWIFRLDSNIRIPKNSIYFHSLTWGVDYIKPEIVLTTYWIIKITINYLIIKWC